MIMNTRRDAPTLITALSPCDDLHLLLDGIFQVSRALPTGPAGAEPHDTLVINNDVSWKGAHVERPLHTAIAIPILRPNHFVLSGKVAPDFLFSIRADPDQDKRRLLCIPLMQAA